MSVAEKIKLYISQQGSALGCDLANKKFWYIDGMVPRLIKLNSCAPRMARKMVERGDLKKYYITKNKKDLVVYY